MEATLEAVRRELAEVDAGRADELAGDLTDRVEDLSRLGPAGDEGGHMPERRLLLGECA